MQYQFVQRAGIEDVAAQVPGGRVAEASVIVNVVVNVPI
jgi:hypothetical protein